MKKELILLTVVCCAVSCKPKQSMPGNTEYKTMIVSQAERTIYSDYAATIRGEQDVEIYPQVSGTLTAVNVQEGASVKKGEILFVIDQAPYRAALEKAKANVESTQANLRTAQMTYDSKVELYKENVVSDFDLQNAKNTLLATKAQCSQAKAELVNAQTNLSYTEIRSPVNGTAGMVSLRVGALVGTGMQQPLVSVSDNSTMRAYFSISEKQYLMQLKQDTLTADNPLKNFPPVELRLSDGTVYELKGQVDAISGMVNQQTGTVTLRATFSNPRRILLSGSRGNIIMPIHKTGVLVIPQEATYEIQDKIFVYKVIDGKTQSFEVKVYAANDGKEYLVEEGIAAGDVIIAEGAGLLRNGVEVTVK